MNLRVRLVFPENLVREPVLSRLVRHFDVEANIRRADIDERSGWIICELSGERTAVDGALAWLDETGVEVDPLGDVVEG